VEVARSTGQEISQNRAAEDAQAAGYQTSQPNIGNYLHYLGDALLVRQFPRYPLARRASSRTPSKYTLTDLGARNAVFRGAPSLWESSPEHLGPLIETLVQSVMRGRAIQMFFWRDYERPGDRRTPLREVDFVAEHVTGRVIPIEVKFRRRIDGKDSVGLRAFLKRYPAPYGVLVTRDKFAWHQDDRILCVPLRDFLLAF
jgi:predicted AAA+ superfamily ATPase